MHLIDITCFLLYLDALTRGRIVQSVFFLNFLILSALGGQPRVISTSPQMTEILFQVGQGNRVVGTTAYSTFPPEAARLPVIGSAFSLSLEKTLSLQPTWVAVDRDATPPDFVRSLRSFQIPHAILGVQSLRGVFETGAILAKQLGSSARAERWSTAFQCIQKIPSDSPFTFLVFAWANPIVVYGPKTFLSDLLTRLGGKNLAPQTGNRFPALSEEFVAVHAPDLVFFPYTQQSEIQTLAQRWWHQTKLVGMNESLFSRASLTPLRHLGELQPQWEDRGAHCLSPL